MKYVIGAVIGIVATLAAGPALIAWGLSRAFRFPKARR